MPASAERRIEQTVWGKRPCPDSKKIAPRRHKATGLHYVTLPNGSSKDFSKNPPHAEQQYTAWLTGRENTPAKDPSIPKPTGIGSARLRTVQGVFNPYLSAP
jgi:hypothetical protein